MPAPGLRPTLMTACPRGSGPPQRHHSPFLAFATTRLFATLLTRFSTTTFDLSGLLVIPPSNSSRPVRSTDNYTEDNRADQNNEARSEA
jgi:hypothetical protein